MANTNFIFDLLTGQIAKFSLLAIFITFFAYTVAYILLIIQYKLPKWTSISSFEQGKGQMWFKMLTFCQVMAFLMPLFFLGFVISLNVAVVPRYRVLTEMALSAGILFTLLSSVHYYVQFTLARADFSSNAQPDLEHLYQLNPKAIIASINNLGWTFFFGISCLCLVPLFLGAGNGDVFGVLLLVNGLVCVVGLIGNLGNSRLLTSAYSNLMGLIVLIFSILGFFQF
jgi:hypothetical protein